MPLKMSLPTSKNLNLVPPLLKPSKSNSPPVITLNMLPTWSEKSEVTLELNYKKPLTPTPVSKMDAELTWILSKEKSIPLKTKSLNSPDYTKSIIQF